ncbi:MAG: magnesium transporter [Actinomycetes bacterium]
MSTGVVAAENGGPELLPGRIEQYIVTRVPRCRASDPVAAIQQGLVGQDFESVDEVVVCSEGRPELLLGLIPLERLLTADERATASDIMDADPPVVHPGDNEEQAAWKAVHHGESSLAVVDAAGGFRGLVPPTRLIGALLRDHDNDFARLGGYLSSTASARLATEEPLHRRLWHRTPWLALGLLGAGVAAWMVGGFEEAIDRDIRLAFFMPGVVYLADAVGTQTEALVIRGMSVGGPLRHAFRLEALTGLALGLVLAGVTFPLIWLAFGSVGLAAAVSLSLMAACSIATVVAMLLPWLIARSGRDPAFGSGPLATVVQDLLSLLVFFLIALPLVG